MQRLSMQHSKLAPIWFPGKGCDRFFHFCHIRWDLFLSHLEDLKIGHYILCTFGSFAYLHTQVTSILLPMTIVTTLNRLPAQISSLEGSCISVTLAGMSLSSGTQHAITLPTGGHDESFIPVIFKPFLSSRPIEGVA